MIYRISSLEGVLAPGGEITFDWTWPKAGLVRACMLTTADGLPASRAMLGLAVQRRGREMVKNDRGRAFAPSLALCGPDDLAPDWSDLVIPVDPFEVWFLAIRNEDTLSGHDPRLFFDFTPSGPVERVAG